MPQAHSGLGRWMCPEFRGKRKWRNLLVSKQIARKGEGGLRGEEGYHD
jgi:hypothetical protein